MIKSHNTFITLLFLIKMGLNLMFYNFIFIYKKNTPFNCCDILSCAFCSFDRITKDYFFVIQICSLENWYYRILILMTGNLKNAEIAVDALSIW